MKSWHKDIKPPSGWERDSPVEPEEPVCEVVADATTETGLSASSKRRWGKARERAVGVLGEAAEKPVADSGSDKGSEQSESRKAPNKFSKTPDSRTRKEPL